LFYWGETGNRGSGGETVKRGEYKLVRNSGANQTAGPIRLGKKPEKREGIKGGKTSPRHDECVVKGEKRKNICGATSSETVARGGIDFNTKADTFGVGKKGGRLERVE